MAVVPHLSRKATCTAVSVEEASGEFGVWHGEAERGREVGRIDVKIESMQDGENFQVSFIFKVFLRLKRSEYDFIGEL